MNCSAAPATSPAVALPGPTPAPGARVRTALRQKTLSQLEEHFAPALPAELLEPPPKGDHSRPDLYTLALTF